MPKHKGFGQKQQQVLLVDGWLLPELRENHVTNKGLIDASNIKMSLCFILGSATSRRNLKEALEKFKRNKNRVSNEFIDQCCAVASIDDDFVHNCTDKLELLGKSDIAYVKYINKLYKMAESKVKAGEEISPIFEMSREVTKWREESGIVTGINFGLKNGWMHQLADYIEYPDGEMGLNSWMAASMICSTATSRLEESDAGKIDRSVPIANLIKYGILEPETATARLELARAWDGEYLKLVSEVREYYDSLTEQGLPIS